MLPLTHWHANDSTASNMNDNASRHNSMHLDSNRTRNSNSYTKGASNIDNNTNKNADAKTDEESPPLYSTLTVSIPKDNDTDINTDSNSSTNAPPMYSDVSQHVEKLPPPYPET